MYDGSDIHGMDKILGYGPWDHPLLDPNTVRIGGLFTPIGPWATGGTDILTLSTSHTRVLLLLQLQTLKKTNGSNSSAHLSVMIFV